MTAIIFIDLDYEPVFFIVDGDYSDLHDVFIGSAGGEEEERLNELLYHCNGESKYRRRTIEDVKSAVIEGANLIVCGTYG